MKVRVHVDNFPGEAFALRALIYQWNAIKGVNVTVKPTDYVGGSFDITFQREGGALTKDEVNRWVATALAHIEG